MTVIKAALPPEVVIPAAWDIPAMRAGATLVLAVRPLPFSGVQWRGRITLLGDHSFPYELVAVAECDNAPNEAGEHTVQRVIWDSARDDKPTGFPESAVSIPMLTRTAFILRARRDVARGTVSAMLVLETTVPE